MRDPADFNIAPPVAEALMARRPVVALETTLVTHGFPHPEGLTIAAELEAAVTAGGAQPATIGIVDGLIRVGLDRSELERLATRGRAAKLNLSNLAAHLVPGSWGSTTVAATLLVARRAGIRVFATGGIGGVHRNATETGDISADLTALARFPVAVVCAGAKAVLDLPRTIELLETLGVPVFGFGTDEFPAFYSRDSGLPVDRRFDEIGLLAEALRAHVALNTGTGVIVANPVGPEHELPRVVWQPAIERALADATRQGIRGRDVTPFLLERLRALTDGASVFSNRALLVNNARLAARLAVALHDEQ
ncbi:MAG TPA: pseudouridine-5'-phosphate glycosidase [Vicinamibacterales bacterium]